MTTYNSNTGAEQRSTKPFEPTVNYEKVSHVLFDLYTRLPNFNGEHIALYAFLCKNYNASYGYAFPDTWDIAMAVNCGESKVASLKKVLSDCGLVEIKRSDRGNDVYIPLKPIDNEREFYGKFPMAREYYEKRRDAFDKRRKSGARRKSEMIERERETDEVVYVKDSLGNVYSSADF